ncbi:uncharacterized protein TRIADDRAFT_53560 [Trichoplax adhaerens]|uniref:CUB domain-containing protein n=1 Tax=Trichoplax adhaerens TaxID=10228 RepID=B3RPJ0_TRIAD|nr:hypothetical protein TRIADDRAFT_53560 [Trichoplax adhaerens]EDV28196.1 hypothetical protein TRIADDRAFT_53560 [Trichoplax adhaerens]|eukprot:XP_002110030.1 hypothetical protein TRIADDRAFT_53560 [Trichoplax adhaerens]
MFFTDFELEQLFNCNGDSLTIYDGSSAASPLAGQYCGSSLPFTFASSTNSVFMRFLTDKNFHRRGFDISYMASLDGCSGTITGPTGSLTSPNYPFTYPNSTTCTMNIDVLSTRQITVTWTAINIQQTPSCDSDYVALYNGQDTNAQLVGKYCGSSLPSVYTTTNRHLTVLFVSDEVITSQGFRLTYTTT